MNWYVFYTPRGWAAIRGEKRTMFASVLPSPSPLNTFHHNIEQTGFETRFVALNDYSVPIVNKYRHYFSGQVIDNWEVDLGISHLSAFSQAILRRVYQIPYGQILTYGQVAESAGHPGAARAVGQVMRLNPLPLIVPCHRVISSQDWGGFSSPGGLDIKKSMLHMEWQHTGIPDNVPRLLRG